MLPVQTFDAILFDLNGTLAEGYDRFGPDEDYHHAYRGLGGGELSPAVLRERIEQTLAQLLPRYHDGPADPFPTLRETGTREGIKRRGRTGRHRGEL